MAPASDCCVDGEVARASESHGRRERQPRASRCLPLIDAVRCGDAGMRGARSRRHRRVERPRLVHRPARRPERCQGTGAARTGVPVVGGADARGAGAHAADRIADASARCSMRARARCTRRASRRRRRWLRRLTPDAVVTPAERWSSASRLPCVVVGDARAALRRAFCARSSAIGRRCCRSTRYGPRGGVVARDGLGAAASRRRRSCGRPRAVLRPSLRRGAQLA